MKGKATQRLAEARIEIDDKVTKGGKLPEDMILYAVDSEQFVIAAKPLKNLEKEALLKVHVKVVSEKTSISSYFQREYMLSITLMKTTIQLWLLTKTPQLL